MHGSLAKAIPSVSRAQIAKLDELMVKRFKIPVQQMMELAGYRLAELVRMQYPDRMRILICCGTGNNGGDGIAAARHLLNFGFSPEIFLLTQKLKPDPENQLRIAQELHISIRKKLDTLDYDLIIDCLLGYNIVGEPRPDYSKVIKALNASSIPIVACDLPSGIDTDEGVINETYIHADTILFLSLPKKGCDAVKAAKFVADIGVPKALYPSIGIKAENYFAQESIVSI